MKKTHIAISILLAIALLYLMWFVGFEQGKKAFASNQYDNFLTSWKQNRGVEYEIKMDDGSITTIYIAPVANKEGQILIKPK